MTNLVLYFGVTIIVLQAKQDLFMSHKNITSEA